MEQYLESVPNNWKRRLVLSAVPKDGTLYEDEFSVTADRPVSYWGQIYTLTSPLLATIRVFRTEGRILADISVSGNASVPCARCLEPAKVAISGELRYLFSLRQDDNSEKNQDGSPDGDEDLILLDSWEDEIDLSPQIWEVMITSFPAKALCRPDCKGLCPVCGTNLNRSSCTCKRDNIDPRLESLRSFVQNDENGLQKK